MPCVFCNKPTSDDVLIDFEGEQAVGRLRPRYLSMLNDGRPTEEEVDGELRPVCVRQNCSERPRYGVLRATSSRISLGPRSTPTGSPIRCSVRPTTMRYADPSSATVLRDRHYSSARRASSP